MNMGTMNCEGARPLVPSYLDGELSEAQAGPLRKHLLACQPCRASAQTGKNLQRWFAAAKAVDASHEGAIPRDFAARVAQMAFAGVEIPDETPSRETFVERAPSREVLLERAPVTAARVERDETAEDGILVFVMRLTVAAAVLALLASVAIQSLRRPTSSDLRADDRRTMTLDQALDRLDRLERAENGGAERPEKDASAASQPGDRTR
jgi:hypothetical protein